MSLLTPLIRAAALVYRSYALLAFSIVALVICCPLILIAPTLPMRRAIGRFTVRAGLAVAFMPFRVSGLSRLPSGPCVVVANHASYLDGIVLTAALPGRFTFLVQHGAKDWPYIGRVLTRMGVIYVERGARRAATQTTHELIGRLANGESLGIFPEGTFQAGPELLPFHSGAFLVAARAKVPVVPAVIVGTRKLLPQGQWLPQWSRVTVNILEPVALPADQIANAESLKTGARRAIERGLSDIHAPNARPVAVSQ